ncbi:hypothetical protein [Nakamurella lactea]|uniref:hypothetical protein n=1 Tax=Nakamurella lactea TaxID=459515 RepID=UPI0004058817|nr:hypothetical protein [Nakamurella lactea]
MTSPTGRPASPSAAQQTPVSIRNLWSDTPTGYKGGIVVAVIAWFLSLSTSTVNKLNGVVTCQYFDLAKVGGGALVLFLAVGGFVANARAGRRALPTGLSVLIAVVLIAVGALLVVRGLGLVMSPCQSLTTPA